MPYSVEGAQHGDAGLFPAPERARSSPAWTKVTWRKKGFPVTNLEAIQIYFGLLSLNFVISLVKQVCVKEKEKKMISSRMISCVKDSNWFKCSNKRLWIVVGITRQSYSLWTAAQCHGL